MAGCWFYILCCVDGSYYVGTSRSGDLETRISQHNQGIFGGYTAKRRPVTLVYSVHFDHITDAIAYERQVKGWSRPPRHHLLHVITGLVPVIPMWNGTTLFTSGWPGQARP
jgi:putative endonuclease